MKDDYIDDLEISDDGEVSEKKKKSEDKEFYKVVKDYLPLTPLNYDPNEGLDREKFIAYKQFLTLYNPNNKNTFVAKGKLYPLYVNGKKDIKDIEDVKGNKNIKIKDCIEVGKWYRCGQGELRQSFNKEDGSPAVIKSGPNKGNYKYSVKSSLGKLSYRPGWHCGTYPLTRHIGVNVMLDDNGKVILDDNGNPIKASKDYVKNHKDLYKPNDYDYMKAQNVWAEVEFSGKYNFTDDESNGENGIFDFRDNPEDKYKDGFYYFRTNTNASKDEDWIIADAIKVRRVLTDDEVEEILNHANETEGKNFKNQKRFPKDSSDGNRFNADFEQFKISESEKNNIFSDVFKRFN